MTKMGELMNKIGAVNYKSNLSKEEQKTFKILLADGIAREIKRGKGRPTLIELTQKGKMIAGL